MKTVSAYLVLVLSCVSMAATAQPPDDAFDYADELAEVTEDVALGAKLFALEKPQADPVSHDSAPGMQLRSRHLIFGLPRLTDNRYAPAGGGPGVSLLVREGFVVGYSDVLHCPIWVAQRWTKDEYGNIDRTPELKRDWKEDPELPADLHVGVGYSGTQTGLDRGHMARHQMNRSWGLDASIAGCLMTNSVPQHLKINRGSAWGELENAVRDRVKTASANASDKALWTISGALFRDADNPVGESPGVDLTRSASITGGFRVPYATYKIVAWFDGEGLFHARGYIFEQPYTVPSGQNLKSAHFTIPAQDIGLKEFIHPIDEIESRAGVDFFADLNDSAESGIESAKPSTLWGSEH